MDKCPKVPNSVTWDTCLDGALEHVGHKFRYKFLLVLGTLTNP